MIEYLERRIREASPPANLDEALELATLEGMLLEELITRHAFVARQLRRGVFGARPLSQRPTVIPGACS